MNHNFLKLNQYKTEIIAFGLEFNMRKFPTTTLRKGDYDIQSQTKVWNLGAI